MPLRDTPRATVSGWLRWLLVLSLALNMLVIGAVASAWLRHGGPEVRHGAERESEREGVDTQGK